MSVIMRRSILTPKMIVILIVIIGIVIGAIMIIGDRIISGSNKPLVTEEPKPDETTAVATEDNSKIPETTSLASVKDYDGYWTSTSDEADLWVFFQSDGTINFNYSKSRDKALNVTGIVAKTNEVLPFTAEDSTSGTITLKDNVIELKTSGDSQSFIKASTRVISRRELFEEINNIINSRYTKVDNTMFTYEETNDYLSLKLLSTCYIKPDEQNIPFEGNEYLRDVYIIDKIKGKLINLQDLLENNTEIVSNVDNYIKGYLEIKKLEYDRLCQIQGVSGEPWPYKEFDGVLDAYNYESKYFDIDETNKNVNIKVLPYPDEARKALGDIWVAVPFEVCFSEDRCNTFKVSTKKFNPTIDRNVAMAYLKFIISRQDGNNMEDFGSTDTDFYNLIYFTKTELAIVDKDFNYKKYSYDENMNITESDDFNNEYTSIREKKYSPQEIKQVFCLSSKLYQ